MRIVEEGKQIDSRHPLKLVGRDNTQEDINIFSVPPLVLLSDTNFTKQLTPLTSYQSEIEGR